MPLRTHENFSRRKITRFVIDTTIIAVTKTARNTAPTAKKASINTPKPAHSPLPPPVIFKFFRIPNVTAPAPAAASAANAADANRAHAIRHQPSPASANSRPTTIAPPRSR